MFDRPNHVTIAHDYMNISIPQGGFDIDPNSTLVPFTRSFKIEPKFNYSNSGPKKKV